MSNIAAPIRESTLSLNLSDTVHTFACELAMACRKVGIYGVAHPQSSRAVEKPFFILGQLFQFKTMVGLNARRGQLYIANICLKETVFDQQIIQYMQGLDVSAILLERSVNIEEFRYFVQCLVSRESKFDDAPMADRLRANGIESIHINSERAHALFEDRRKYRGDVDADFSVRRMALDQFSSDIFELTFVLDASDQPSLLSLGFDFAPEIIRYLLPERVAEFSVEEMREVLSEQVAIFYDDSASPHNKEQATSVYLSLIKLTKMHPDREQILAGVGEGICVDPDQHTTKPKPGSITGRIQLESQQQTESLLESLFVLSNNDHDVTEFCDSFARLSKTGQQQKADDVITRLIDLLCAADPGFRQRALSILSAMVADAKGPANRSVVDSMISEVVERLKQHQETYEFSEITCNLFQRCHEDDRFAQMAKLTTAMAERRSTQDNVTIYDSMAVKKGFEGISNQEAIGGLVDKLTVANREEANFLRHILVAIGSDEVAVELSRIISHPIRGVRQLTLKILAELGKASLKVFSRILQDPKMFSRETNRRELPDSKWYVIRNSIFVLGSLTDPHAVPALRERISDTDVRIRREIVSALEKIGGDDAIDCLIVMAEDADAEIREAAVIAIGLVGCSENTPLLIDVARRVPAILTRAATTLGMIGGTTAIEFLGLLLNDPQAASELVGGKVSRDDLRLCLVKALGQTHDSRAKEQVEQFRESQSSAKKIFFKNSALNKAIAEALK